ncbi:MAG: cytochrome c [Gammaproteobacteria bacterium]|nr:cytochrome c [Gammaproteobacteria bacterium]
MPSGRRRRQRRLAAARFRGPVSAAAAERHRTHRHHDLEVLARTVREGGEKLGGYMPAFGDTLGEADIAAVIAYVQSLWPDDVYAAWAKSYPDDAAGGMSVPARASTDDDEAAETNAITAKLAALVADGIDIGEPEPTAIEGIYAVSAGPRILYRTRAAAMPWWASSWTFRPART